MKTKKIKILSWKKHRHESGFRLNLINHVAVFVQEYGVIFTVDEKAKELYINIIKYADKYDYSKTPSEVIGTDDSHIDECQIIGNSENMRQFQKILGYSSIGNDMSESQNNYDLAETFDDLKHSIVMLEYSIAELKNIKG
mgnify:CR=1 FL=1